MGRRLGGLPACQGGTQKAKRKHAKGLKKKALPSHRINRQVKSGMSSEREDRKEKSRQQNRQS
jgi:hypothetical protein